MLRYFTLVFIVFFSSQIIFASSIETTPTGIPLDAAWKQKIYQYAINNVKHSAWGLAHAERDYQLSHQLANQEGITIDSDIIFAAAFLHDLGGIVPFKKEGMEHSARSVELAEPLLQSYGFPMQKWLKVKSAILGHMFYAEPPTDFEAMVLHDADVLDFLGAISVVRMVSITERDSWIPYLSAAMTTLNQFKTDLPNTLMTSSAKKIAAQRVIEMDQILSSLNQETWEGKAL